MASKRTGTARKHAGRVTLGPCPVRGDDLPCAPLNKIWLLDAAGATTRRWAACSCGRRFGTREVPAALPQPAVDHIARLDTGDPIGDPILDSPGTADAIAAVRDPEATHDWAGVGVVPVGTEVLHRPTAWVDLDSPALADLEARLLRTQDEAHGIGLAANQVGAGVRALAHNLPKVAPTVWFNPTLLSSTGEWVYEEGCLSLEIKGTWNDVTRPKVILVHAFLSDRSQIVAEADELFARVLQHELDHLEGIEYVQHLTGSDADRVYRLMSAAGIDTAVLPRLA